MSSDLKTNITKVTTTSKKWKQIFYLSTSTILYWSESLSLRFWKRKSVTRLFKSGVLRKDSFEGLEDPDCIVQKYLNFWPSCYSLYTVYEEFTTTKWTLYKCVVRIYNLIINRKSKTRLIPFFNKICYST